MDGDEPRVRFDDALALVVKQDLDPLSVAELEARIAALEGEVARVRRHLAGAARHRANADRLFR